MNRAASHIIMHGLSTNSFHSIQLDHITLAATTRPQLKALQFGLVQWVKFQDRWIEVGPVCLDDPRYGHITQESPAWVFLDGERAEYFDNMVLEPLSIGDVNFLRDARGVEEFNTATEDGDYGEEFFIPSDEVHDMFRTPTDFYFPTFPAQYLPQIYPALDL